MGERSQTNLAGMVDKMESDPGYQKTLSGGGQVARESGSGNYGAKMSPQTEQIIEKGDDLMARATATQSIDDGDVYSAKIFQQGTNMIAQKMGADPLYAAKINPIMEEKAKSQNPSDMFAFIRDESDNIKLEAIKAENPEWFKDSNAANYAFLNSATFGQLSRIMGKAGELIDGRPAVEHTMEQAEKMRLLEKAFPGSDLTGKALSFFIPGSPIKALFGKAVQLGNVAAKGAVPLFEKISKNPAVLKKLEQVISGGVGAGVGGAVEGGVTGTLGANTEEAFDFDRGVENSLVKGGYGVALGGALPMVAPAVRATGQGIAKTAAYTYEKLGGTPAKVLRDFIKDPKKIQSMLGAEDDLGQEFVDRLVDSRKHGVMEIKKADELLDQLPDVDPNQVINFLKRVKGQTNPKLDAEVKLLREWGARLETKFSPNIENPGLAAIKQQRGQIESAAEQEIAALNQSIARKKAIINSTIEIRGKEAFQKLQKQEQTLTPNKLQELYGKNLSELKKGAADEISALEKGLSEQVSKIKSSAESQLKKLSSAEESLPSIPIGKVSARAFREELKTMQSQLEDQFGEASNFFHGQLKTAQRMGRVNLVETAAAEGGEVGKLYGELMAKGAKKVGTLKYIANKLGRNEEMQRQNSEKFFKQIFGPNKEYMRKRLSEVDRIFQTNTEEIAEPFLSRAQQAATARQLGPQGVPEIFPSQQTGRSTLGIKLGAATGGAMGAMVGGPAGAAIGTAAGAGAGGALSSPRIGAAVIGGSDKISGFLKAMTANPEALKRMAGIKLSQDAARSAGKMPAVPIEVRDLAGEIYKSLVKDGPISAGSTTRLIADSPYFIGLAHYFDVAERSLRNKEGGKEISRPIPGEQ